MKHFWGKLQRGRENWKREREREKARKRWIWHYFSQEGIILDRSCQEFFAQPSVPAAPVFITSHLTGIRTGLLWHQDPDLSVYTRQTHTEVGLWYIEALLLLHKCCLYSSSLISDTNILASALDFTEHRDIIEYLEHYRTFVLVSLSLGSALLYSAPHILQIGRAHV